MRPVTSVLINIVLSLSLIQTDGSGRWSTLAPMPTARQELSVAVLKGKVYTIAGYNRSRASTDLVEVYDPKTNTWASAAPLPIATNHNAAAVAAGTLYAFGGTSNRVFAYDRGRDAWTEVAPMRFTHGNTPAVAVIEDRIYVAGGTGPGMAGNEVEVYNPADNTWRTLAAMNVPRNHAAGGSIDGKFYVVGGRGSPSAPTALEVYDPRSDRWTMLAPMPTGRSGIAAAVIDGELYVFGGEQPRLFGEVEVYNPASNTWRQIEPMPTPRHGIAAGVIGGAIYIPGGATQQGFGATDVNEVFKLPPVITGASVSGKKLFVFGRNFDEDADILLNGERQKTANDADSPHTILIGKKAGKRINVGEAVVLQVENLDGTLSEQFRFTRQ